MEISFITIEITGKPPPDTLWQFNIAIEDCHVVRWFTYQQWRFSSSQTVSLPKGKPPFCWYYNGDYIPRCWLQWEFSSSLLVYAIVNNNSYYSIPHSYWKIPHLWVFQYIYIYKYRVQLVFSNSKFIAPASPGVFFAPRGNSKAMPLGCNKLGEIQGLFRRKSLKAWPVGKMGKKHI